MVKTLYILIAALLLVFVYTIYTNDLRIKETREYGKKVVLYTQPKCGFCTAAKQLLGNKDVPYIEIDITWDKELQYKLYKETKQSTVPYVFVNGKFIGGYQELQQLEIARKLDLLLNDE